MENMRSKSKKNDTVNGFDCIINKDLGIMKKEQLKEQIKEVATKVCRKERQIIDLLQAIWKKTK